MSDKFKGFSYNTSWTQDYPGWENNFVNALFTAVDKERETTTQNELARLDFLEDEIQEMTEYPDVERLLANILK
tara:strand:+ start:696 stop:917 length:222 start_codon:yes stop_codon:yes gene_type:complete